MDPISQAAFGCAASTAIAKKAHTKPALICGIIGGMAADLDIFIKSDTDPLLSLEFHRHFTHSIFFIPFGGFLVATFCFFLFRKRYGFKLLFTLSSISYATHGILDACTSYGTLLFWPLYNQRIAFDNIAIIDPLFTLPLMSLMIIYIVKQNPKFGKIALIYAALYLSLGYIQKLRVKSEIHQLAKAQNHTIEKLKLNPTIGNIILWRGVYKFGDKYYINAIRKPILGATKIYKGNTVNYLDISNILGTIPKNSPIVHDLKRFHLFSQGFIYHYPYDKNIIADLRYSTLPNNAESLWGIKLNQNNYTKHVEYIFLRNFTDEKIKTFKTMLSGKPIT